MSASKTYYSDQKENLIVLNEKKLRELKDVFRDWYITVDNDDVEKKFREYLEEIQKIIDVIIKSGKELKTAIDNALDAKGKPSKNNREQNIVRIKEKLDKLQKVLQEQLPKSTTRAEAPIYRQVTEVGNLMDLMSKLSYFYRVDELHSSLDAVRLALNQFILRLQYEMTILNMMSDIIDSERNSTTDDDSQEILKILTSITNTTGAKIAQATNTKKNLSKLKIVGKVVGKKAADAKNDADAAAKKAEEAAAKKAEEAAKKAAKKAEGEAKKKEDLAIKLRQKFKANKAKKEAAEAAKNKAAEEAAKKKAAEAKKKEDLEAKKEAEKAKKKAAEAKKKAAEAKKKEDLAIKLQQKFKANKAKKEAAEAKKAAQKPVQKMFQENTQGVKVSQALRKKVEAKKNPPTPLAPKPKGIVAKAKEKLAQKGVKRAEVLVNELLSLF